MYIMVKETGEVLTVIDQFQNYYGYNAGVEHIEFADGTIWNWTEIQQASWFRGTEGDDTLVGTTFGETLYGSAGDDILTGAAGNDTFVFIASFGHDVITDFKAGAATDDVIAFEENLFSDFDAVLAAAEQIGKDVRITLDDDNDLLLKMYNWRISMKMISVSSHKLIDISL